VGLLGVHIWSKLATYQADQRTAGSTNGSVPEHWMEGEQGSKSATGGRALERRGLVERDLENAWLATDIGAGPLDDLLGHSITYRIAVGPRAGQKLFTLQTVPPVRAGSHCMPVWTLRRISARSSNACAVT
jgi:hypothetical protein